MCAVGRNLILQPGTSPNWTAGKTLLPGSSPGPGLVVMGRRKWKGTGRRENI